MGVKTSQVNPTKTTEKKSADVEGSAEIKRNLTAEDKPKLLSETKKKRFRQKNMIVLYLNMKN